MVGLSTLSGTHMCIIDVLLHQPDSLQESPSLVLSLHEPPFLAPSTSDAMEITKDQRNLEEAASYLK